MEMSVIVYYIKLLAMNWYMYICFARIMNIKKDSMKNIATILVFNFILSLISIYIKNNIDFSLSILALVILYNILLAIITKMKLGCSLIIGIISYAICMCCFGLSVFISFLPYKLLSIISLEQNDYVNLLIILVIQFALIHGFFKIKRFKSGLNSLSSKLNNEFADIIMTSISTIIILLYCLNGSYYEEIRKNLFISFLVLIFTMVITIQCTLTMYYKQKLLKETMNDYERELVEKDKEIERLKAEKFNISKITHEFYNRQKALEMSVKDNLSNMETAEELGALDRIQDLTKEYSQKLEAMKSLPTLPLTEIPEIDDMFKYMQTECDKNKIEFRLKIVGDMFYLVNHIISKNKLATMIGDHIRDAIIAINFSKATDREIFVILGIKDKKYELCIYDTGIEFEIDTLLKLGLEQITTHKDTGGGGIGFITTFETLSETKASLIIKELSSSKEKHYTKAVIIRFDNKHQYKICSYRAKEIKENNKDRKVIIEDIASEK